MEKLGLMVCPHDTANKPERWFLFALYLSKSLEKSVVFSPSWDFKEFHDKLVNNDLIYANPMDSLRLFNDHGYTPLAHPAGVFDEIVFICSADSGHRNIIDIQDRSVASVASMLPTSVALGRLQREDISPSLLEDKDSWLAVVGAVIKKKVEFGFVYKDFYDGLNESTRAQVKALEVTDEKQIYHMVLASPNVVGDTQARIKDALLTMHETETGRKVSEALSFSRFIEVEDEQMSNLENLTKLLHGLKCECGEQT